MTAVENMQGGAKVTSANEHRTDSKRAANLRFRATFRKSRFSGAWLLPVELKQYFSRLIFLHTFPLDGRMWNDQMGLLPGATAASTLYRLGDSIEAWAGGVLAVAGDAPLIVVGSSMGAFPNSMETSRSTLFRSLI